MSDTPPMADDNGSASRSRSERAKPVLRDTAYRNFMDYLMSGQLKPGLLVSQRELCESTDSTIGAMREALKRLEAEGIVTLVPQRGVIVREPSESAINDVYEARKIIESHAVRIYAETGDLDVIAAIKLQTQEIIDRKADTREEAALLSKERIVVDDLLHKTILTELHNQAILDISDKLIVQIQVNRLGVQPRFIDSRPALREHLVIIEALENRNAEAASKALVDHLECGRRRAVGLD